jgi:hypothetical protein
MPGSPPADSLVSLSAMRHQQTVRPAPVPVAAHQAQSAASKRGSPHRSARSEQRATWSVRSTFWLKSDSHLEAQPTSDPRFAAGRAGDLAFIEPYSNENSAVVSFKNREYVG